MSCNQTLRHSSAISQLENDRYTELETADEIEQAWKRGHNTVSKNAVDSIRAGKQPDLTFITEHEGDDIERAHARGHNAGIRHVRYVLSLDRGLGELAYAPTIRTISEPLLELDAEEHGGEG